MKFIIALFLSLTFTPFVMAATEPHNVDIYFTYEASTPEKEPIGYSLYMDGYAYRSIGLEDVVINDDGVYTLALDDLNVPFGIHEFSLTAMLQDGTETGQSPSVAYNYEKPDPYVADPVPLINKIIRVTEEVTKTTVTTTEVVEP